MEKSNLLTTPILFLIFNRPDKAERVFDEIRKVKPFILFVSADGPRRGFINEVKKCQAARDIIKQVDWKCKVYTNFHEENLGLKLAISSAIDWFFENVKEGIILEDDCLPSQSFFWFCQELLERYRDDERIMMISGTNLQFGQSRGEASYYFSRIAGIWGWATWKRAWKYFDINLDSFPKFEKQNQIKNVFDDKVSQIYWMTKIQQVYDGGNSWAFAWAYSLLAQNGLCICSNKSLVSNIGFGPGAVHATNAEDLLANIESCEIGEIIHPDFIIPNRDADICLSELLTKLQLLPVDKITLLKNVIKTLLKRIVPKKPY